VTAVGFDDRESFGHHAARWPIGIALPAGGRYNPFERTNHRVVFP